MKVKRKKKIKGKKIVPRKKISRRRNKIGTKKPKRVLVSKKKKSLVKKTKLKAKSKPVKRRPVKIQKKVSKRKPFKVFKARKPKKKLSKAKKVQTSNIIHDSLATSFFKAKIKVIGIGGGGGSIVSEIGRSLHKATFVVADTDTRAFRKRAGIKNFLFGQALTHGLGTGVNPQLGRLAAESEKEKIASFFDDQDIVIFIASLGGGLSSGATQIFAEAAKDFNGITLGIFTLPFKFEGKNKYKIAVKALRDLRKVLNVSITIPNERIFKIIQPDTAITDAFSIVNRSLIESLESLIDLIYSPGIINIDFADLRAILAGRGNLAFLNTIDASGKDKAEQIAQNILHNPLYQNNGFTAEKILFNITGGSNLSMLEVDKISRVISEKNKKAKIIFGISKDASYKNKIKATLLMTSPSQEAKAEKIKLEEAAKKLEIVTEKPKKLVKKKIVTNVTKKIGSAIKKQKRRKKTNKQNVPASNKLTPVFGDMPFSNKPVEVGGLKKISIIESPVNSSSLPANLPAQQQAGKEVDGFKDGTREFSGERKFPSRKPIRRTALDIKKAQELKENKQSLQEKEWEIPAFLRLKK